MSEKGSITEEFKEIGSKYTLSKHEYDLYHEEDDKAEKVYRVKKSIMPNKGEKWKLLIDNKPILIIESSKITKAEWQYLRSVEGFNFMLSQTKIGVDSLSVFKAELKKILKNK